METRKLQSIGGGTSYAVSLPKQWVEAQGLRAGDEVLIENRPGGELCLATHPTQAAPARERMVTLRSTEPDEVVRTLIGLYVSDFDTAVLDDRGADPQAVRTGIGEACVRLPGLQVVEEAPGRIVLQNLSDTSDLNFSKGLRRMQSLVLQMLGNVGRLVATGGGSVYHESERCEAELDRLLLLLLKQYTHGLGQDGGTVGGEPAVERLNAMFVAQYLERIGDYAMRISAFSQFLGQEPSAEVTKAVKTSMGELSAIVSDALKAFNTRDVELANQIIRRCLSFGPSEGRDALFDVFTSPRTKPQVYSCVRCIKFFTLLESLERISLYAKSIAEVTINAAMAQAEPKVA